MTDLAFQHSTKFVVQTCCKPGCGVSFAIPSDVNDRFKQTHQSFYCINGHGQFYPEKSEEEKLRERLKWAEQRESSLRDSLNSAHRKNIALKGVVTRTKKRIGNGVCPCCNRSFSNLRKHIETKHPSYKETE